jgi:hypothetical protein
MATAGRLAEARIDYAIAGAIALGEHGFLRLTVDVDVLIRGEGALPAELAAQGRNRHCNGRADSFHRAGPTTLGASGPAHERLDGRGQRLRIDRLGDVHVVARIQSLGAIFGPRERGEGEGGRA